MLVETLFGTEADSPLFDAGLGVTAIDGNSTVPSAPLTALLLLCSLACVSGCSRSEIVWTGPLCVRPLAPVKTAGHIEQEAAYGPAERLYGIARERECQGIDTCVDLYFDVARLTCRVDGQCRTRRQRLLHKSALAKIVLTGQRFKRINPCRGLRIRSSDYEFWVPISFHGFVWQPSDFHRLVPVGNYESHKVTRVHRSDGAGIPMVVENRRCPDGTFLPEHSYFAATLVMDVPRCEEDVLASGVEIKVVDPLRVHATAIAGRMTPIAKDTSAPFVYRLKNEPAQFLGGFFNPYSDVEESKLFTVEPFQPGKIPVVFAHGLLSDPYTWIEMLNDLQACPWYVQNYQTWVFEYPTGQAFVKSAAELREQLVLARHVFDPGRNDPSLSDMVVVGHSMGGLIAKLQVTHSGTRLWDAVSAKPFDDMKLNLTFRQELQRYFFFDPSPDVGRAVFIGTPHRGSGIARRPIGILASALVSVPQSEKAKLKQAVEANPGVFTKQIVRGVPSSIDLLNPRNELLQAMEKLPTSGHVTLHTIFGNSRWMLGNGPSDGVVPVSSARDSRAISELEVDASHFELNDSQEAVNEVLRILNQHLQTHVDDACYRNSHVVTN